MTTKLIQLLIFICPLFMFGQDTVSYWFSKSHLRHLMRMTDNGMLVYPGSNFNHTFAPNGEEYTCGCDGPKNCCDRITDLEMVCLTVGGKIVADAKVKLNSKPERPEQHVKDTILVPIMCANARAVYGTFQYKDKIVGTEIFFTRKYFERTLEERTFWSYDFVSPQKYSRWADEIDNSGEHYYEIVSTRWLEDVTGCYQLLPLENKQ